MDVTVIDVPERSRYEARTPSGGTAGFAEYLTGDKVVVFTHTEVDPAFEGQGVGSRLARGALDAVRETGRSVLTLCPFVKGWIEKHPEYADLVQETPPSRVVD